MAHFAELDETNTILRVIVVSDEDTANADGVEDETIGVQFCTDLLGGVWMQTSRNGDVRARYAGVGYTYDAARDAFVKPQPFPSWELDDATAEWEPPVPAIAGYNWDEDTVSWQQPDAPFPSWIWTDGRWQPPVAYVVENPTEDDPVYVWDEDTTSWVEVE